MSVHVNPVVALPNEEGTVVAPEIMILFPEETPEFNYIRSLLNDWEYYISPTVELDATANINIEGVESTSQCHAYIYGWQEKTAEWQPGMASAIIYFTIPEILFVEKPSSITIQVEVKGQINLFLKRTVPIVYEETLDEFKG
jgi:hypothetical protein